MLYLPVKKKGLVRNDKLLYTRKQKITYLAVLPMKHLRSRTFKSLLLLLLGWSLLAAFALPNFERIRVCQALQTIHGQTPFVPVGEGDNHCDGSATGHCCDENEIPESFPPARISFSAATISGVISVPYLGSIPPEVYLERFIPPQNHS